MWRLGGTALLPLCLFLGLTGPAGKSGTPFLIAYTALCVVYLLLYWKRRVVFAAGRSREVLLGILGFGVLARILIFSMPASDDVHRYLWEGRLQQLGGNPYTEAPADAEHWVPRPNRPDRHRGLVNHPELTTVYPPGAQILFLLATEIRYSAPFWKLLMLAGELVLVGVLLQLLRARGMPRTRIWRYFWHPLPLVAFAGEAHLDVLLLLGSWMFFSGLVRGRQATAAVGWSFAILTKILGILYAPIAIRRLGWQALFLAVVLGIVFTLPFVESGSGLFRTLVLFGREMSYNDSWQILIAPVIGEMAVRGVGLAVLATVAFLVVRRNWDPIRSGFYLTAAFLLVSPTVHPWYVAGLVPFLVFRWRTWAAIWSCTVGWAYVAYSVEAQTGRFHLPHFWAVAEYLPVYAALIWGVLRSRRASRPNCEEIRPA